MAFRLPPLNAVRLFEAAGRLLSFKLAADELHLTPSAISHGVQTLEEWLGTPLFVRGQRSLSLTEPGECFLRIVQEAFAGLCVATEKIPGRRAAGTLSVKHPDHLWKPLAAAPSGQVQGALSRPSSSPFIPNFGNMTFRSSAAISASGWRRLPGRAEHG